MTIIFAARQRATEAATARPDEAGERRGGGEAEAGRAFSTTFGGRRAAPEALGGAAFAGIAFGLGATALTETAVPTVPLGAFEGRPFAFAATRATGSGIPGTLCCQMTTLLGTLPSFTRSRESRARSEKAVFMSLKTHLMTCEKPDFDK